MSRHPRSFGEKRPKLTAPSLPFCFPLIEVYEQDSNSPWAAEKAAKTKKKDDEQFEKQLQLERAKASGMQHKVAGEVDEGAKVLKAGEKMD